MARRIGIGVLRRVGWEHMQVVEDDDGLSFILGYIDGKWKLTRRDCSGNPVPFANERCEKRICSGVLGDAELDVDERFICVTVPIDDMDGYAEYWSEDGGDTWEKQA